MKKTVVLLSALLFFQFLLYLKPAFCKTPSITLQNLSTQNNQLYESGDIIGIYVFESRAGLQAGGGWISISCSSVNYNLSAKKLEKSPDNNYWFYYWDTRGLAPDSDYRISIKLYDNEWISISAGSLFKNNISILTPPPVRRDLVNVSDISQPSIGVDTLIKRIYRLGSVYNGSLGYGWSHSYNIFIKKRPGGLIALFDADAKQYLFKPHFDNSYISASGDYRKLSKLQNGNFILKDKYGTVYYFNKSGKLAKIITKNNNQTTLEYDDKGLLRTIENPSGGKISFNYNWSNKISSIKNSFWRKVSYRYDAKGRLVSVTDPMGYKTKYDYDAQNRLKTISFPNKTHKFFDYDEQGRLIAVYNDEAENRLSLTYHKEKPQIILTNAADERFFLHYNNFGMITQIKDAYNNKLDYIYNDKQNLAKITKNNKLSLKLSYDKRGNITRVVEASNEIILISYEDKYNQVKSFTDTKGNVLRFSYDKDGNLGEVLYPNKLAEKFVYNAAGELIEKTDRKGRKIHFEYNSQGRLIKKKYPNNTTTSFLYDRRGNLIEAVNKTIKIKFDYDRLNRIIGASYFSPESESYNILYKYDPAGNRIAMTYPDGYVVAYQYDKANRLMAIKDDGQGELEKYSYDKTGRRLSKRILKQVDSPFTYNKGDVLNLIYQKVSKPIDSIYNTQNPYHERLFSSSAMVDFDDYVYNPIVELIKLPAVNINLFNRIAAGGEVRIGEGAYYKADKRQKEEQYEYDANGNIISKIDQKGTAYFAYDYENRLIKVEKDLSEINYYYYDPLGRIIIKEDPKGSKKYIYDGIRMIMEQNLGGEGLASYVYGPAVDEVLRMRRNTKKQYYTQDGIGSAIMPY